MPEGQQGQKALYSCPQQKYLYQILSSTYNICLFTYT